MDIILNTAGGLSLFLIAMSMMTDGLKVYAGGALKHILQKWTSRMWRAVLTGALITGVVQSSSAITIATIGFVNAGILSLKQALGVIFGANIGTTVTGWLVSLIGFHLNIEPYAMLILALGTALHFLFSSKRIRGLGKALMGFGLFFLGLSILKDAFSGIAESFGTAIFTTQDMGGAWAFVGIGFLATVLTQSSSASIALILTAATQGIIGINVAAAAIIGANIGTTSTALLASIHATSNAKRVALGHIAFNLITGIVALSLLPIFIWITAATGDMLDIRQQPAPFLALFHTVFNCVGVLLFFPFISKMAAVLQRFFRTQEEDLSQTRYLDRTLLETPALALPALWKELARLHELCCLLILSGFENKNDSPHSIKRRAKAIRTLGDTIDGFATHVRMEHLSHDQSEELPVALRAGRYLQEAARLAPNTAALRERLQHPQPFYTPLTTLLDKGNSIIPLLQKLTEENTPPALESLADFQNLYQKAKEALLSAAAENLLTIDEVDALLDYLSRLRRMIEQIVKATRLLTIKASSYSAHSDVTAP